MPSATEAAIGVGVTDSLETLLASPASVADARALAGVLEAARQLAASGKMVEVAA